MPRRKKDPSVRARRNKAATRATLTRVIDDVTTAAAYEQLTVAQLRVEVARRNDDGRTTPLSAKGRKADLVAALLADDRGVPEMPEHPTGWWHAQTAAWWEDVWSSPMSKEWDDSDIHNVFLLALLYNDMWCAGTPKARKEAATEFRLQRADLGLSPYSRRRLEWTIETAAEATERGQQRRNRGAVQQGAQVAGAAAVGGGTVPPAPVPSGADDPRRVLEVVK